MSRELQRNGDDETPHALVYRDKKRGGGLHRLLKRFGRRKQRFGAREYRTNPDRERVSIEKRPAIVARRARIGDYEADLVIGYRQSGNVVVVNDRTSRAVSLRRVKTKRVSEVRPALVGLVRYYLRKARSASFASLTQDEPLSAFSLLAGE